MSAMFLIQVSDSVSRLRCAQVCWHPDVATQMALASEDDHSPVIQLWDLRFATSPVRSLENHQRGRCCVLSLINVSFVFPQVITILNHNPSAQVLCQSRGVLTTRTCCCLAARTIVSSAGIPTPMFRAARSSTRCLSPRSGPLTYNGAPETRPLSPVVLLMDTSGDFIRFTL